MDNHPHRTAGSDGVCSSAPDPLPTTTDGSRPGRR